MKYLFMFIIKAYQALVSPVIGARCRFYPSCSEYALESFRRYGSLRGGWLALRRLVKCHPFHPGGIDPVPEDRSFAAEGKSGSASGDGRPL
ncbi:MAG: membrane protein insertion efficiency factor YidD [Thermodesulfobacteriota bacterium]